MVRLSPEWSRWVTGRPFTILGMSRRPLGLTATIAALHFGAMLAVQLLLSPVARQAAWHVHVVAAFFLGPPLAVVAYKRLRALDDAGFLSDLAVTPVDRLEVATAFLRRFTLPAWAIAAALLLEGLAFELLDTVASDELDDVFALEHAVWSLLGTALLVVLSWHAAIVFARAWDFAGESIGTVVRHLGRFHRYVLLPVALVAVPLLAVAFMFTLGSLALASAVVVVFAIWTGDGAWGWLPAIRDHPLFEPLREDEF